MDNVKRETSRVSRVGSAHDAIGSDRRHSGMFSRAYNTVSARGQRGLSQTGRASSSSQIQKQAESEASAQKASKAQIGSGHQDLVGFTGVFPVPEAGCKPEEKSALTQEQEQKYKTILAFFQKEENQSFATSLQGVTSGGEKEPASDWEKLRMLSRESLLRYLRATKWDVPAAQKRIIETIAWRREFGVDGLDSDEMAKEAESGKETVLGYDNNARPLHYMHPHRNNTKESPRQMQYAVWILERCIDIMPPGVEQLALLINFDHRSRNPTSIANAKLMLYILQSHYVERLGIALCINVPWVFKMFWSAIQPFIDPATKSKCRFDEAIKTAVPLSQLSADFGGNLDATYKHDAYFPELVKVCEERREGMKKRFAEQCNSEIGASEWIIRGGDDPTSPFNVSEDAKGAVAAARDEDATSGSGHEKEQRHRVESNTTSTDKSSVMTGTIGGAGAGAAGASALKTPDLKDGDAIERFKTPRTELNAEPLERYFSTTSIKTTGDGTAVATKVEKHESPRASKSFANGWTQFEGGVTRGFKDMEHKFQSSKMFKDLSAAFHPDSRRSSRDQKRASVADSRSKTTSAALSKDNAALAPSGAVVAENKDAAPISGDGVQLPSAAEAVALAGAAGCATAATTIGSIAAEQAGQQMQRATSQASASFSGMLASPTTPAAKDAEGADEAAAPTANGLVAVALPHHDDSDGAHQDSATERKVTMLFFAAAKDAVGGKGKHELVLPSDTPAAGIPLIELSARLLAKPPQGADVATLKRVMMQSKWSVDEEMVDDDKVASTIIRGGEDVAIIPPVSGG